jgi:hypothetical protein
MDENESAKEKIIELKAASRMNELRIQALLNILAREGVVSKEEFRKELESLCEEGEKEE